MRFILIEVTLMVAENVKIRFVIVTTKTWDGERTDSNYRYDGSYTVKVIQFLSVSTKTIYEGKTVCIRDEIHKKGPFYLRTGNSPSACFIMKINRSTYTFIPSRYHAMSQKHAKGNQHVTNDCLSFIGGG